MSPQKIQLGDEFTASLRQTTVKIMLVLTMITFKPIEIVFSTTRTHYGSQGAIMHYTAKTFNAATKIATSQ
jgi:hypothetical protein